MAIERVVQTMAWSVSDDWAAFARMEMPPDQRARFVRGHWHLLAWTAGLPDHVAALGGP